MTQPQPKFSIITATYNAGSALSKTAESLRRQTFTGFEWVIIDGGSNDGTIARVQEFGGLVSEFVSEFDTGIYCALNKGLDRVRGEWVLILGAGDELAEPEVLSRVAPILDALLGSISTVYGSVMVHDAISGQVLRHWDRTWQGLEGPWGGGRPKLPCHQGVFQRASLFKDGFRFDERCKISADNEILLRELIAGRGVKINMVISRFDFAGVSADSRNRLRMIGESIWINWKLGIFRVRPIYQVAALMRNALAHMLRVARGELQSRK